MIDTNEVGTGLFWLNIYPNIILLELKLIVMLIAVHCTLVLVIGIMYK